MQNQIYSVIASCFDAMNRCAQTGNTEWEARHEEKITSIIKEYGPSGSGFDNGTTIDFDASKNERLVFSTAFHHMNDGGMYNGWTHHTVIVTPSLVHGYTLRITGRNRDGIKEYIAEIFGMFLSTLYVA